MIERKERRKERNKRKRRKRGEEERRRKITATINQDMEEIRKKVSY